jgi:hypothetical protein
VNASGAIALEWFIKQKPTDLDDPDQVSNAGEISKVQMDRLETSSSRRSHPAPVIPVITGDAIRFIPLYIMVGGVCPGSGCRYLPGWEYTSLPVRRPRQSIA